MQLVQFPEADVADVAASLRKLADSIEAGKFGAAHNIAYVCDCGDGEIAVGYLGRAAQLAPSAYYLLGLGMRHLEKVDEA